MNDHIALSKSVIINNGVIDEGFIEKYHREEDKSPVVPDWENLTNIRVKMDDFVIVENGGLKHDTMKLSLKIFEELLNKKSK